MKTLFKTVLFVLLASVSMAQIPNAGFENWSSTGFPAYAYPNGWGTLNGATSIIGIATVIEATGADVHSGNSAVKLKTEYISFASRIAPAICVTGTINTSTESISGGFQINYRPTKLVGWYKYAPQNGDTCQVEVTLWKRNGGTVINIGEAEFNETATVGAYTKFEVDITYFTNDIPDSARIFMSSSSTGAPQQNSTLFIDDLQFIDCSTLSVTTIPTDVTTQGGSDGAVDATVSGGTGPYTYAWSNSAATEDLSGVPSDNYCVTVTDANGCTASSCAVVSSPSCTGFGVNVTDTDPSTVGGTDGIVYATPTGGTAPYSFSWDTQDTINLSAGTYCVTVTDNAGCIATGCVTLTDPDCSGFSVTATGTDATSGTATDGSITAIATGGYIPYFYTWSNFATDSSVANVAPGEYCVTVSDNAGCTATDCVTIGPDCSGFGVNITTTDASGNNGTAIATATDGTPGYTYQWNIGTTGDTISGLLPGIYCVTAFDANGCTATACDSVHQISGIVDLSEGGISIFPNPAQTLITVELNNVEAYSLRLFDARGKVVLEQLLSSKNNTLSLRELAAGNYIVQLQQLATGKVFSGKLLKE